MGRNAPDGRYVLVTAAHNEAGYIDATIKSIVAQAQQPLCWVIVNDGSTDGTAQIVKSYEINFDFIRLVNRAANPGRSFESKVEALKEGIRELIGLSYDCIGNLDADVSVMPDYFATLMQRMRADPGLGICGGKIYEKRDGSFRLFPTSRDSVAGAVQLFRRECFEEVGGYRPLRNGYEDAVAEITARMLGWRTLSFDDLKVLHHRRIGTAGRSLLRARLMTGMNEYRVGYHFLFHLLRALRKITQEPPVLGSLCVLLGYLIAFLQGSKKIADPIVVRYLRKEQGRKLLSISYLKGVFGKAVFDCESREHLGFRKAAP